MDLAWLLLNNLAGKSGDHAGLSLLRYTRVPALVRVKVAVLRAGQTGGTGTTCPGDSNSLLAWRETDAPVAVAARQRMACPLGQDHHHPELMQIAGAIACVPMSNASARGLDALAQAARVWSKPVCATPPPEPMHIWPNGRRPARPGWR